MEQSSNLAKDEWWEHFPHEADMGVRGIGKTLEPAFAQAAIALTAVITEPADVTAAESIQIEFEDEDVEMLFYDWMSSLIYEMATRSMLFCRFELHIESGKLTATVWGEKSGAKHSPAVEVKGASFTELKVYQKKDGSWCAQCVVDV